MIAQIISENEAIIELNLSSFKGSMRNRLGKDGGLAIAYGLSMNRSLIQYLNLRATTISNDEIELIAEALENYLYLLHLDLAENRLEGARGGNAIAQILRRKMTERGGVNIESIILSRNKIGDKGATAIVTELLNPGVELDSLNLAHNDITNLKVDAAFDGVSDKILVVKNLILDGNQLFSFS